MTMQLLRNLSLKKGTKSVLFYAQYPHNFSTFEPVFEILEGDPKMDWHLCAKPDENRSSVGLYKRFGLERRKLVDRRKANRRDFDLYISSNFHVVVKEAKLKIATLHSISFNNCFLIHKGGKAFDKLFLLNPYMRRKLIEAGRIEEDDPRAEMIGFPKVDCMVDGSISRDAVLTELGLPLDRPVVLYAPGRSEHSSLYREGHNIIEALAKLDVSLIVKLHDFYYNEEKNSIDWPGELKKYADRENVRIDDRPNIAPLLCSADLLVSDFSSVANEYLLMDRPIVFMDAPGRFEEISDRVDLETWGRKTGTILKSAADLPTTVPRLLAEDDGRSEVRQEAARDLFYKPGTAAVRSAETIRKYIDEGLLD